MPSPRRRKPVRMLTARECAELFGVHYRTWLSWSDRFQELRESKQEFASRRGGRPAVRWPEDVIARFQVERSDPLPLAAVQEVKRKRKELRRKKDQAACKLEGAVA